MLWVSAVLLMTTLGVCTEAPTLTVAVQGAAVAPGAHSPPAGGVVLAVLVMLVDGVALTVAVTVYTAELPAGNVAIVSLMAPLPLAVQVAPPLAAHVHVCELMPAGSGSLTTVPFAATEPALLTVTV